MGRKAHIPPSVEIEWAGCSLFLRFASRLWQQGFEEANFAINRLRINQYHPPQRAKSHQFDKRIAAD